MKTSERNTLTILMSLLFILFFGCGQQTGQQEEEGLESEELESLDIAERTRLFSAELEPVNQDMHGMAINGTASISIVNNMVTFQVNAYNLPADIMHLQHLHGYKDNRMDAQCPPETADKNNDEIIDLIETRDFTGVTLIPLHENPVSLEIKTESYPVANSNGTIDYGETVDLNELGEAVSQKYGINNLDFSELVISFS